MNLQGMKKRNMHLETFIHTIIYITFLNIQIADCSFICPLSTPTMKYVTSCPHNKTEWEKAVQRKNCESMAPYQNCTEPKNFQYHCLINHLRNATLEVCAPIYYLQGYCAYYNTNNKEIMENYDQGFECLKFSAAEQCPSRYPSSEAYKYLRCYAPKNPQLTTPMASPSSTNEAEFRSEVVYIVFVTILSVALVAVSSLFIWRKRETIIVFCTKVCKPKDPQSTNLDETEQTNQLGCATKSEQASLLIVEETKLMADKHDEKAIIKENPPPRPVKPPTRKQNGNTGRTPQHPKNKTSVSAGKKTDQRNGLEKQLRSKKYS